ncbi:hypothetical protein K8R14_04560 [bacterium]|nr:hypothetical protein [bacterium]
MKKKNVLLTAVLLLVVGVLGFSSFSVKSVAAMPVDRPLACHFQGMSTNTDVCEEATIKSTWVGSHNRFYKSETLVDGEVVDDDTGWGTIHMETLVEDIVPGVHTTHSVVYEWKRIGFLNWGWVLRATSTQYTFTVEKCYVLCSETVTLDKVYGEWYDVGDPVWNNDWIDNGDGTFTQTGTQATAVDWTQEVVDKYDETHICDTDEGSDPGSREVTETRTPTCETTIDQGKEYGDWYDIGDPVWEENWVDNGDGTFTLYGTQVTARDWTQEFVDSEFTAHVCDTDEGSDPGSREVTKTGTATCETTIDQGKEYGDWYDIGDPVWEDDWIDNGDGTFTLYGTQVTARDWTQEFVDSEFTAHVCDTDEGSDPGSREVTKTQEGSEGRIDLSDCFKAYVCDVKYIDTQEVSRECDTFVWEKENFLEVAELFLSGEIVLWPERAECEPCIPVRTDRWMHLFRRLGSDHDNWTTICQLEAPKDHFYTEKELAEKCAYGCEPQTWELGKRLGAKMIFSNPCSGVETAGNWYDSSCEVFGLCEWLDSLQE